MSNIFCIFHQFDVVNYFTFLQWVEKVLVEVKFLVSDISFCSCSSTKCNTTSSFILLSSANSLIKLNKSAAVEQDSRFRFDLVFCNFLLKTFIVGKGGHAPPFSRPPPFHFSKIPPFLEIQDVPTFHRFTGKTKVLNNSCNQFVCNFYPQIILVLEECLQK